VCEQNAWAMHPSYTGYLPPVNRDRVYQSCMMANGWRPESSEPTSTQLSPQPASATSSPTTSSPKKDATPACDWRMYWLHFSVNLIPPRGSGTMSPRTPHQSARVRQRDHRVNGSIALRFANRFTPAPS
jgi:hypothetical protein